MLLAWIFPDAGLKLAIAFLVLGFLIASLVVQLAGLLGRYSAEVVTQQIGNDLIRVIAGIVVGWVVGMGVGMLAKKTLRRLVDVSSH